MDGYSCAIVPLQSFVLWHSRDDSATGTDEDHGHRSVSEHIASPLHLLYTRPTMERKIFLKPGEQVTIIAGARRGGRPLISEEERRAQVARQHALSQAREA